MCSMKDPIIKGQWYHKILLFQYVLTGYFYTYDENV